jgi:acetylornithine deacetylase/succinyl-diaminopimelate desuccinylase-like protein
VTIAGFYDDVVPPGSAERAAFSAGRATDLERANSLGFAVPDGDGRPLLELLSEPSLNVDGFTSGWLNEQARTIVPDRAIASLDLRLVKNVDPDREVARVVAHIARQGYHVIAHEPTMDERSTHARLVRVDRGASYRAARTSMDLPVARAVIALADEAADGPSVKVPLLGGSIPMYVFEDLGMPVIGVPIVNFDDRQHAPDENVRLGHLWRGIEVYGAIIGSLDWR